jgi:multidrug efflux pump subunit AcrA (membrane-fusion protein)
MRKIILSTLGGLLLVGTIFIAKYLVENNQRPKPKFERIVKSVFVETVQNKEVPIVLTASGNLMAKQKIELYSEVQGVLKSLPKPFKEGSRFRKEETLLSINSDEFYASLQAQKSNLLNLITSMIPDILLDYPKEFEKWESYLKNFYINKPIPKLPETFSDKEKYFITGRGITTAYYNVKNLEVRFLKYIIKAPFSGVLTEALVTPGTLIRVGQKLGEFIDPSIFEMEIFISAEFGDLLKVGNAVALSNLDKTKEYKGEIIRVNGKVDRTSQTIKVFIQVAHKDLKEGMFLEAAITARAEKDAMEISRKLLIDNEQVYLVKNDSILSLVAIDPVYFGSETVIVKGLENNSKILIKSLPGAYNGMIVKINKSK